MLIFNRQSKADSLAPKSSDPERIDFAVVGRELAKMQREAFSPPDKPGAAGEQPLLPHFNFLHVAVLDSPSADALLALITREREAWADHFAWTTDARASVDLFATAVESLAIVIDSQLRLRSVVPITHRLTTEELLDQLTAALLESVGNDDP